MVAAELQGHELNGRDRLMVRNRVAACLAAKERTGKGWMPNRINGESRKGQGDKPNLSKHWTMFWCFLFVRANVYKHMYKQNKKGASPCRRAPF
jgi:hypothetical protein